MSTVSPPAASLALDAPRVECAFAEPERPLSPSHSAAPSGGEGARRAGEGEVQDPNARPKFEPEALPEFNSLPIERATVPAEASPEPTTQPLASAAPRSEDDGVSVHQASPRIRTAGAAAPSMPGGMSRAEPFTRMKNAPETGRMRQVAGQELPGRPATTLPAQEMPRASVATPASSDEFPQPHTYSTNASNEAVAALSPAAGPGVARDVPAAADASPGPDSARIIHELRSAIPSHAIELRQARGEALMVVLRPDAQTTIHLQLLGRDGQVDVRAQIEHGNFQALNAQWGELQQALSSQGIRLGELRDTGTSPFSGGDASGAFARSERETENQNSEPSNPGRTVTAPRPQPAPALALPRAAAGRTWESWA